MEQQNNGTTQAVDTTQQEENTQAQTIGRVTKFIFWLGFTAFLATSIPHVAWLWHVFEGTQTTVINVWGMAIDEWWIVSYAVAVGIDVLIAWLSFIQTIGDKTAGKVTWVFIAALSALSWYANYLYDMQHSPNFTGDIWDIGLLGGVTTTGYITPIIVSALPVFVVAYTFMLSRMGKGKKETAASLRSKANELQALRIEKKRIASLKWEGRLETFQNTLAGTSTMAQYTLEAMKGKAKIQPAQTAQEDTEAPAQEETTEDNSAQHTSPVALPVNVQEESEQPAQPVNTDKLEVPVFTLPVSTVQQDEAPQVTELPAPVAMGTAAQNGHTGRRLYTRKTAQE